MRHVEKRIIRELKPISLYLDDLYQLETMIHSGSSNDLYNINYFYKHEVVQAKSIDELVSDFRIAGIEDIDFIQFRILGMYVTSRPYNTEVWLIIDTPKLREKLIEVIDYLSPLQIENKDGRANIHLYNRERIRDIADFNEAKNSSGIEFKDEFAGFNIPNTIFAPRRTEIIEPQNIPLDEEKPKKKPFWFLSSELFWVIFGVIAAIILGILELTK